MQCMLPSLLWLWDLDLGLGAPVPVVQSAIQHVDGRACFLVMSPVLTASPGSSLQDHVAIVLRVLWGPVPPQLGTLSSRPRPTGFAILPGACLPAACRLCGTQTWVF